MEKQGLLYDELVARIFSVTEDSFRQCCLDLFSYQYRHNPFYKKFADSLKKDPGSVKELSDIPFLPIEFFKTEKIVTGDLITEPVVFTSSGTTGTQQSKHYVKDIAVYEKSFRKGFEHFYGNIEDHTFFALLPSYLEREGSSLVYMMNDLIHRSGNAHSGFYLENTAEMLGRIRLTEAFLSRPENKDKKNILIGVTYALLDLVEKGGAGLQYTIVMETGGMKGKRKEMVREELHQVLCEGFNVKEIHSEYGMTELLSQAYSKGKGIFRTSPWMKVLIRDTEDPLTLLAHGRTGGINVIDLANINSCCFIATQDLGRTHADGSFEVMGRFDNSDIRGCNLMME